MLIEYFGCRFAINRENEYFLEVKSRTDVFSTTSSTFELNFFSSIG